MLALAGEREHLRGSIVGDRQAPGFAAGELEGRGRNARVEEYDIGRLQGADGLDGEKVRRARAGADQADAAQRHCHDGADLLIRGGRGVLAERLVGEALPEGAALRARGEIFHHPLAQPGGQLRPERHCLRQQGFDAAADGLAENGRGPGGGNADHERRAIDDGAELELAEFGTVDDVIGHRGGLGGGDEGMGFGIGFEVGYGEGGIG